jgi:hypothetical protein
MDAEMDVSCLFLSETFDTLMYELSGRCQALVTQAATAPTAEHPHEPIDPSDPVRRLAVGAPLAPSV